MELSQENSRPTPTKHRKSVARARLTTAEPEQRNKVAIRPPPSNEDDGVVKVELTGDTFAILDVADWESIKNKYSPNLFSNGGRNGRQYAYVWTPKGNRVVARELLGARRGQRIKYINGDSLDIRRANLQFVG